MVAIRPAGPADCQWLWQWRNEESVREASFNPTPIAFADHQRWFADRLADPSSALFVVMADGREVGYVRFDLEGEEARVSVALAPEARGHGYGPAALQAALRAFKARRPGCRVVALIRSDNARSEAAFRRAGFVPAGHRVVGGVAAVVMEWPGE